MTNQNCEDLRYKMQNLTKGSGKKQEVKLVKITMKKSKGN
jgi:hypothetical protein